jgi:hypothetical protein
VAGTSKKSVNGKGRGEGAPDGGSRCRSISSCPESPHNLTGGGASASIFVFFTKMEKSKKKEEKWFSSSPK